MNLKSFQKYKTSLIVFVFIGTNFIRQLNVLDLTVDFVSKNITTRIVAEENDNKNLINKL